MTLAQLFSVIDEDTLVHVKVYSSEGWLITIASDYAREGEMGGAGDAIVDVVYVGSDEERNSLCVIIQGEIDDDGRLL